ncbi:PepSY domain-containing protein [Pseudomonas sp. BMS12]|uniref:PepSY domain-containing protein n=1 Tax=Pseudomonas sp. BMS12 TaxID=1796033 RepID=UPI00083A0C1C|nr:PepSY domain-containing protein [Pseudomonas sp. BMS12]
MNTLASILATTMLAAIAGLAQARDLGPDEVLKLRDAGTIQRFEALNEATLAKYPGGKIEESELEEEHGRYGYQVEVRDAQGVQWDIDLDAATGQILKEHRDD